MSISCNKLLALALSTLTFIPDSLALTSLAKNDPDPVYTSLDPHYFLYTRKKLELKGYDVIPDRLERIGISISPFGHNADDGKDINGQFANLGDMNGGRWNMLALMYGQTPAGCVLPPCLEQAQKCIFNGDFQNCIITPTPGATEPIRAVNNPEYIDQCQEIGFFTIPMVYRKRGVRFEFDAMIHADFGVSLQTGVTDITQILTATCEVQEFINLTNLNTGTSSEADNWFGNSGCAAALSRCNINQCLMDQVKPITQELCLNIGNFHAVSIEEIRLNAFWRHAFPFNTNTDDDWPQFLLIPFFQASGSCSLAKPTSEHKAFAVPLGNNRHASAGFNTGVNIDFFDTVEIGGEFGYTHFFARSHVDMRVPNSPYQTGIYPFRTQVKLQPGSNWNFAAKMSAYHFIDRLSMYFQWMLIDHTRDEICLECPDCAFFPGVLEARSDWKIQVANVGFNYDISPYVSLGFLWQAPLNQKNVYKSSLVMLSLNGSY
ncbi:MAG: hypothetical protein P4L31_01505 [Candidatus Babeliales bacterium]|nr:hypothetical protein [Candidatus Babeliales bacterium]